MLEAGWRLRLRCLEPEVIHLPSQGAPGLLGLHVPAQWLPFSTNHLLEPVIRNLVADAARAPARAAP